MKLIPKVIERELQESTLLKQTLDSTKLVAKSVFQIFVNERFQFKNIFKSEGTKQKLIKQIIQSSYEFDGSLLLEVLHKADEEDLKSIEVEFFYPISRRYSKNQSIEKNALLFIFLNKVFGFNAKLIKGFLTIDRDSTEIDAFIQNLEKHSTKQELDQSFINLTIYTIVKTLAQKEYFDIFFKIIQERKSQLQELLTTELNNELIISFMTSLLEKHSTNIILQKSLNFFQENDFQFNEEICGHIMKLLVTNKKETLQIEQLEKFIKENNISKNTLYKSAEIEYKFSINEPQQALKILNELKEENESLSEDVYSSLIKGLLKCNQIDEAKKILEDYQEKISDEERSLETYHQIFQILLETQPEKLDEFFEIFQKDKSIKPDSLTFNLLLKGLCKNKDIILTLKYFKLFRDDLAIQPNRISYNSVMDLAVKTEQMNEAFKLLENMQKEQITPDSYTYSIIINGLKLNNVSNNLAKLVMKNVEKVIVQEDFPCDQILFNSIFDVTGRYQLYDEVKLFYKIQEEKNIIPSQICLYSMVKAYIKENNLFAAYETFNMMIQKKMFINDSTHGIMLETCAKNKRMDLAMNIYNQLKVGDFEMNSIVFTTILKGYLRSENYDEGMKFFNDVKSNTKLPGIIITYNCALDLLSHQNKWEEAIELFKEIDRELSADLISYSTLIKCLCTCEQKNTALIYTKQMVERKVYDISVVNLYLENCANRTDYKYGLNAYNFIMSQNVTPNEITFGIMVKIFGFAKQLDNAFEIIDLMAVYGIKPSIILFTNLIHNSFYNKQPKKAELAFKIFKKKKIQGDSLIYSKIIDGLFMFKEGKKVGKYMDYALEEKVTLKPKTIQNIEKFCGKDQEIMEKLEKIKKNAMIKKGDMLYKQRQDNGFNINNPKRFKDQIKQQKNYTQNNEQTEEKVQDRNKNYRTRKYDQKNKFEGTAKPKRNGITMHNFRKNVN